MDYRFGIVGCDRRMTETAKAFKKDGFFAGMLGSDSSFEGFDVIVLPIGCDFERIRHKCEGKTVFSPFDSKGCINYLKLESFKRANAVPSAEGAVHILMGMTDKAVDGMDIGVVGLGAIGKRLVKILSGLGACVTAFARGEKPSALPLCKLYGTEQAVIFNTVPAPVITRDILESIPRTTLIIDLASRPGGVDFKAAEALGIRAVQELGIPARYAPETAGGIIKDTVISYLRGVQ